MGPGGVGKLTIGRLVAERLGCRLVDNHYWLNPIFGLIEQDGVTPLPKIVWPLIEQLRDVVFNTIATVSPPDWGFVFTHQVTAAAKDWTLTDAIASLAARRKAHVLGVQLTCGPEELARRVTRPERRLQMKDADSDAARAKAVMPPIRPRMVQRAHDRHHWHLGGTKRQSDCQAHDGGFPASGTEASVVQRSGAWRAISSILEMPEDAVRTSRAAGHRYLPERVGAEEPLIRPSWAFEPPARGFVTRSW